MTLLKNLKILKTLSALVAQVGVRGKRKWKND